MMIRRNGANDLYCIVYTYYNMYSQNFILNNVYIITIA